MLRHSFGLACQADAQPIAYFLANSGAGNAVDLNIIANSWIGHEIFLVDLAAVKIPRFKGITAAEGQLFRCCSFYLLPGRALCPNESGAAHLAAPEAGEVRPLRLA